MASNLLDEDARVGRLMDARVRRNRTRPNRPTSPFNTPEERGVDPDDDAVDAFTQRVDHRVAADNERAAQAFVADRELTPDEYGTVRGLMRNVRDSTKKRVLDPKYVDAATVRAETDLTKVRNFLEANPRLHTFLNDPDTRALLTTDDLDELHDFSQGVTRLMKAETMSDLEALGTIPVNFGLAAEDLFSSIIAVGLEGRLNPNSMLNHVFNLFSFSAQALDAEGAMDVASDFIKETNLNLPGIVTNIVNAFAGEDTATARAAQGVGDVFAAYSQIDVEQMEALRGDNALYDWVLTFKEGTQDERRELMELAPQDGAIGFTVQAASAASQMLPAIIVAWIARNPALGAVIMGSQAATGRHSAALARGATSAAAFGEGVLFGLLEAWTEKIPLGKILGSRIVGANRVAFTKRIAQSFGSEAVQEGIMSVLDVAFDAGILNEDMTLEEIVERVGMDALTGAVVGASLGLATEGVNKVTGAEKKAEALSFYQEKLAALHKLSQDAKLRERSPEKMREALETTLQDPANEGKEPTVFVSAEFILKLRQGGLVPEGTVNDVDEEPVSSQEDRGGDVEVKLSELLDLPKEHFDAIAPHIRRNIGDQTVAELEEEAKTEETDVEALLAGLEQQATDDSRPVFSAVRTGLVATGMAEEEAEASAELYESLVDLEMTVTGGTRTPLEVLSDMNVFVESDGRLARLGGREGPQEASSPLEPTEGPQASSITFPPHDTDPLLQGNEWRSMDVEVMELDGSTVSVPAGVQFDAIQSERTLVEQLQECVGRA